MAEVTGSNDNQESIENENSQVNSPPFNQQTATSKVESQQTAESESTNEATAGPIGINVGTSNIVMAQNKGAKQNITKQQNAFFTIPQSKFTKQVLVQNKVVFFEHNQQYYIIGDSAENFANMFNANTRKPMERGVLTTREDEGIAIIQAIIKTLVQRPKKPGEVICFSIPGEPLLDNNKPSSPGGREVIIKMYLESLGYTAIPINKGLAVVLAELGNENFTGIGINMGGGMCNICVSYLSIPVITYSIQRGGDEIDESVSREVGLSATKVKSIKEAGLDLSVLPKNKIELALHIYYDDLLTHLVQSMERVIASSDNSPKIKTPIPIVLSGGTASPKGLKEKFESALQTIKLPFEVSSVRVSEDPLNAAAKGALAMAVSEAK